MVWQAYLWSVNYHQHYPQELPPSRCGGSSGESPVLYFEADDGTIRLVAANYGLNYCSLSFKAVTVPRNQDNAVGLL